VTASDDRPARERFELVVEPAEDRSPPLGIVGRWLRRFTAAEMEAGMQIFHVLDRSTGETFLRHIEPADDAHVFEDAERDLAAMTVAEFEARWRA
jgi:hypothetical protein